MGAVKCSGSAGACVILWQLTDALPVQRGVGAVAGRWEPGRPYECRAGRHTSQKADPREMRRSPRPEQAPLLLQRIARMIGTHGVPSRCASVHRYTWWPCPGLASKRTHVGVQEQLGPSQRALCRALLRTAVVACR